MKGALLLLVLPLWSARAADDPPVKVEPYDPDTYDAPTRDDLAEDYDEKKICYTYFPQMSFPGPKEQCKTWCDKQTDRPETENGDSYTCDASYVLEHSYVEKDGESVQKTTGLCVCNSPIVDLFVGVFLKAVIAAAELGCKILTTAFKFVIDIGSIAIPGGPGIAAALRGGVTAAQLAMYGAQDPDQAKKTFSSWADPCGNSGLLPDEVDKVFGILNDVADSIVPVRIPGSLAKGGAKAGDVLKGGKNDKDKLPKDEPKEGSKGDGKDDSSKDEGKDDSKDDGKDKSGDESKDSKDDGKDKSGDESKDSKDDGKDKSGDESKDSKDDGKDKSGDEGKNSKACKQKRGPRDKNCDDKDVHSITKSVEKTKLIPQTCSFGRYPQACYHYHSAINDGKYPSTYTCADAQARHDATAVKKWKGQHHSEGWQQFTRQQPNGDDPNCQADEFPPAYFMPEDSKKLGKPQLIRWLPGGENGGAANTQWAQFCAKQDGGAGNSQLEGEAKEFNGKNHNKDLVQLDANPKVVNNKGTKTTQYQATFTRAIFEMHFENGPADWKAKNYGLDDNPCWPKDILPDDPGYVLLTDDAWYIKTAPEEAKKHTKAYEDPAPKDMIKRAKAKVGEKRPASPEDESKNKEGKSDKGKGKQKDDGGSGAKKRSLEVIELGDQGPVLAVRDDQFNVTRRMTPEEMDRDVQIVDCEDEECSHERRALSAREDFIVIPGEKPPTAPVANDDVVPTIVPRDDGVNRFVTRVRRAASADMPVATGELI